jgi:AcrR family transcriptional regulator
VSAPRERRTARRARTRLTPQLIVEAALEIIDGDGAEALTMRRLGSALGVEAMAIYHHYASKEAVLDAVAARLSQALHPAEFPADAPWEDRLRLIWTWFRDRLKEHPNALPLLFTRPVLSRGDLTGTEALLQALLDAGLSPREAVDAWRALGSYAIG